MISYDFVTFWISLLGKNRFRSCKSYIRIWPDNGKFCTLIQWAGYITKMKATRYRTVNGSYSRDNGLDVIEIIYKENMMISQEIEAHAD
jgi:hypothetical protein